MSVIPCEQNSDLRAQIERFAEVLKTEAHRLGDHGLDERDFYNSGLFRGAVERVTLDSVETISENVQRALTFLDQ